MTAIEAHAHAARYRLPDERGPEATYRGEDDAGTQYLIEDWGNGHLTIATRTADWTTWGPPTTLRRQSAAREPGRCTCGAGAACCDGSGS
ncbi:MAG TPA: hypothetical protein VFJ19_08945 [Nocardioidaceae bacterium]|nr:hypothetical protein [Nocardioidaceae bacterium]